MMASPSQMRIIPLPIGGMKRMNSGTNLKQLQPIGTINRNALTPGKKINKQMPINNVGKLQNISFRNNKTFPDKKINDNNLNHSAQNAKNLLLIPQHLRNGVSPSMQKNRMNNYLKVSNRPNILNNRI